MNVEGVVLKLLLHESNKEKALTQFSKLKLQYFSQNFVGLFKHIRQFYEKHGNVPSYGDLQTFRSRNANISSSLLSLQTIDVAGIDNDAAIDALIDQFAQNTTLDIIEKLLKDISLLDRREIQDAVGAFPQQLDDALDDPEKVFSPKDLMAFHKKEDTLAECIKIGISNLWDSKIGGFYRQDLLLIGGKRGSGKSIVCANLACAQYKMGNVVVYFTIEMTAKETNQRILSILSGVDFGKIKRNDLTDEEERAIAEARAGMFINGMDVFNKHYSSKSAPNCFEFEQELVTTCELTDARIIIVDDRELSTSSIDVQLSKLRAQFGDLLSMAIIDYMNQIVPEGNKGSDMYDWKPQVHTAKTLKNQARKHNCVIVSPFQIDDNGGVRFAKGIEDACDATLMLENDKEHGLLWLKTAKARSSQDDLVVAMTVNWSDLKIDPSEVDTSLLEEPAAKSAKKAPLERKAPDVPQGVSEL